MLDKDITIDDGQAIYCPTCEENYRMVWSEERGAVFVVCDCYEAENVDKFLNRFRAAHLEGVTEEPEDGLMYQ